MKFAGAMGSVKKWAEATVSGFDAMAQAQRSQAARHLLHARDALGETDAADARSAAAHSNAGAGLILHSRMRDASRALDAAEQSWLDVAGALRTAEIPLSGRSSSFHFRLAAQNLAAFEAARRRRYEQLCEAGLAITRFNRLFASTTTPRETAILDACTALTALLADTFGAQSPEARLLSQYGGGLVTSSDDPSPYSDKLAEVARHAAAPSAASPSVCLHLETAVAMTALFPPDWYPFPHTVAREEPGDRPASPQTATSSSS